MAELSVRKLIVDPETRGFFLGLASSIISSVTTLYIVQNYIVQKAASQASKQAIEDYKKEFGIMSQFTDNQFSNNKISWEPLSDRSINKIRYYNR